jgi:hypothetical protein
MLTNPRFYTNTLIAFVIAAILYGILFLLPIPQTDVAMTNMIASGALISLNYLMISYLFFKKQAKTKTFLSVPLMKVLFSFFGMYFIFFFLFTYVTLPEYIIWLTYLVLIFINTLSFYRVYLATNIIESIDKKQAKASEFIKEFASALMTIETTLTNPKTKKKIQTLREELKYASPLSSNSVQSIEKQLTKKLESTKFNDLDDKELDVVLNQLQSLMNNRNLLLKK